MNTRIAGSFVLMSVALGCSGGSPEPTAVEETEAAEGAETTETPDGPEATPDEGATAEPVVAGGWGEGDATAQGPRDAAAFAVLEQSRVSGDTIQLVSIAWVAQQVVSGINYRLGLNITRNGTAEQATAVVYSQPWTSTTQLTSWTPGLVR